MALCRLQPLYSCERDTGRWFYVHLWERTPTSTPKHQQQLYVDLNQCAIVRDTGCVRNTHTNNNIESSCESCRWCQQHLHLQWPCAEVNLCKSDESCSDVNSFYVFLQSQGKAGRMCLEQKGIQWKKRKKKREESVACVDAMLVSLADVTFRWRARLMLPQVCSDSGSHQNQPNPIWTQDDLTPRYMTMSASWPMFNRCPSGISP